MAVSPSKYKVRFFFDQKGFTLENRSRLKSFIETLFKSERKQLSAINYIFCSDRRLLEINQQFLNHDYFTDIITFDLSEGKATEAEIYISVDRVRENAKGLGGSFKSEFHRVIFHGALHLCGYKDKKLVDIKKMREKESFYLNKYGI